MARAFAFATVATTGAVIGLATLAWSNEPVPPCMLSGVLAGTAHDAAELAPLSLPATAGADLSERDAVPESAAQASRQATFAAMAAMLASAQDADETVSNLAIMFARPGVAAACPEFVRGLCADAARIVQALQRQAGDEARRALVTIAGDRLVEAAARCAALRALGDLPATDEGLALLQRCADDADAAPASLTTAATRAFARVLQRLPRDDSRTTIGRNLLLDSLRRTSEPLRQQVLLSVLTQLTPANLAAEALRLLDADDARVRVAAARAIAADSSPTAEQIANSAITSTHDAAVRRVLERRLANPSTNAHAAE